MSPGNPWNPYFPLLSLRVLPSTNFTSSQCLMHFFSFQRTFHHTRKRWILRILWSHAASSSYFFIHFLFSFSNIGFYRFLQTWSFSWVKVPPWALQKLLYWDRKHLSASKGKREPLKTKKKDCCKTACTLLNSFTVYKFQHTRKRWILRI